MERIGDEVRRSLAATGTPRGVLAAGDRGSVAGGRGGGDRGGGVAATCRVATGRCTSRRPRRPGRSSSAGWPPRSPSACRDAVGDDAPPALRFAPGRVPSRGPESPPEAVRQTVPVSPETRRIAGELTAAIDDADLRALVARAAAASLSRGPSDRGF